MTEQLLDPHILPRFKAHDISHLKRKMAGIYFLFDDKELVYIGTSASLIDRIFMHNIKHTDYSFILFEENRRLRSKEKPRHIQEKLYIIKYRPKFNSKSTVHPERNAFVSGTLVTPEIKSFLQEEAKNKNVNVSFIIYEILKNFVNESRVEHE